VSLPNNKQEELFTATNELIGFLPEDDPMVIFSRKIFVAFKDEDFTEYYSPKGRNAKSPALLACVTLLQYRENLSDTETAEACVRRLDWKIALHLPLLENTSFDPSTLCYFRRRLKEHDASSCIFDKIIQLAKQEGFIKRSTKQRIDATHIISHVNRISTTDLLFRAVQCVVEEIEKVDVEFYESRLPEYIKERYRKRFSSFGMSKEKRADKLSEIVEDGLYIKSLVEQCNFSKLSALKQLAIMETIFDENVVIREKTVDEKVFLEAEEISCPKQSIFDPRDTSLQLGRKGKKSWVGSKCHIVETAKKGEINFITNMIYQPANEDDSRIHEEVREGNNQRDLQPEKLFADSNYINGSAIKKYQENKQVLMGYMQGDNSKKPDAFKLAQFDIDLELLKSICPAGKESLQGRFGKDGRITISFSKSICKGCAFFDDCVGKTKAGVRILKVSPHHQYLLRRREEQKSEQFRQEMRVRAQIEGTISEAVRFMGFRYTKYKRKDGHHFQFYLTGAALNVKRLIKAIINGNRVNKSPEILPLVN